MSNIMAVLLNGIAQLEYNRNRHLPDRQAQYLDRMDARMEEGIRVGEEIVRQPGLSQRVQFVAAKLAHAIQVNDADMAAALCSYLAVRLPDLKQVRIEDAAGEFSIELVFDEDYRKQVPVAFSPRH